MSIVTASSSEMPDEISWARRSKPLLWKKQSSALASEFNSHSEILGKQTSLPHL